MGFDESQEDRDDDGDQQIADAYSCDAGSKYDSLRIGDVRGRGSRCTDPTFNANDVR